MDVRRSGCWHPKLNDPIGERSGRGSNTNRLLSTEPLNGMTMVLDKGLGRHGFTDLIETAGSYVDCVKLGFGTSPLYSEELTLFKTGLAARNNVLIMPGGTLLEAAVQQGTITSFFDSLERLGFTAVEVSDGTIEMERGLRNKLIREGTARGLFVFSEYGKKQEGAFVDPEALKQTAELDWQAGSRLVTVEARESGIGIGLFDEMGNCKEELFEQVMQQLHGLDRILWEAPLKSQQVMLLQAIGANAHLGNIAPADALTLEAMRRGLRSDTFVASRKSDNEAVYYMI